MSDRDSSVSSSSGSESDEKKEKHTPANDLVVTKYNMAAAVVNGVLQSLIKKCAPGQAVLELCEFGDNEISEKTGQLFKKEKNLKKGIAFPTCISINNCVCHFSPLKSEKEVLLAAGDVVKIDLGAHVDGFIAVVAHTIVVEDPEAKSAKVTGRKADVILAAHYALEAAIRMLRPGQHKNFEITDTIQKVADSFKCKPVENMLSHQLNRNRIDGEKQIIQNPGEKQRQDLEKCDFEQHEVFAIDVLISTGEGKTREMDARTTVYMKNQEVVYQLKLKVSRAFFTDAEKRHGLLPFTLRSFDDEVRTKMAANECERHALMKAFPVLYEKDGELVAQMKTTVLLMPTGLLKITGLPNYDPSALYESEHKIEDPKLALLLQTSLKQNKKKPKKAEGDENIKPPVPVDVTAEQKKPAAGAAEEKKKAAAAPKVAVEEKKAAPAAKGAVTAEEKKKPTAAPKVAAGEKKPTPEKKQPAPPKVAAKNSPAEQKAKK